MKKMSSSYLINFILIIALTFFALWFALKDNFYEVMDLISNIKWYWFLIIILWGQIYTLIIGWILTVFARRYKKDYTLKEGFVNGFVGSFFSGITPSATGGQFAQAYIFKKQGIKVSDGASLLWADFIVYQTTMMVYVTILFILRFANYYNDYSQFFILIFIGYLINGCVIGALWTMALFPKVYQKISIWAVALLAKMRIIKDKEKSLASWQLRLHSFTKEIQSLKHDKKLITKTVLINLLRMTAQFTLPFIIARAIGIPLPLSMLIDVVAMSSFVSMANAFIPVPGASGGTEAAFILIFSTIMQSTQASSVMILWRFSTYHFVMLVGGLIFILAKRKYDRDKNKGELLQQEETI